MGYFARCTWAIRSLNRNNLGATLSYRSATEHEEIQKENNQEPSTFRIIRIYPAGHGFLFFFGLSIEGIELSFLPSSSVSIPEFLLDST